jgi:hypothetical protein
MRSSPRAKYRYSIFVMFMNSSFILIFIDINQHLSSFALSTDLFGQS